MKIVLQPEKGRLNRPVVALGNFDGVHLGHKKVIESAVKFARKIRAHSAAVTFDPHPQEVIVPERGLRLLTTLKEREDLFRQLGVDAVVVVNFTPRLQKLSYREFVAAYLVKKLQARWIFVGYDYAFGKGRIGDVAELKKLGKKFGFGVTVVPPVKAGGQIVKSGKIRELLSAGKISEAIRRLGHPYRLTGKVVRGAGRGEGLGFPTANLKVDSRKLIPAEGVYAGLVAGRRCVANIGSRPTFGGGKSQIEIHLLNFRGGLRGRTVRADLFRRLRSEVQFADVRDLQAQIKKDIARARGM